MVTHSSVPFRNQSKQPIRTLNSITSVRLKFFNWFSFQPVPKELNSDYRKKGSLTYSKTMAQNSRNRMDEEKGDLSIVSPREGWSFKPVRILTFLLVLAFGILFGLSLTSHLCPRISTYTELFFPSNFHPANSRKENSSIESFIKPSFIIHSMDDEELFWRASLVPKKANYPFKRVPKIAFMFMSRGPLPLMKLWEKFFSGHEGFYSIYVHSLPGYKLAVNHTSPFFERQIPCEETLWGSITLIDAERRLLANALLDFSNERFILLSESCIPVYNFQTIYKYLTNSMHSFVESYDENTLQGRGRYNRKMWPNIRLPDWRKGSQWFELNRELAVNIISDYKYYNLFKNYCKPSCYPDEHYIPTYLNMFYGPLNSNQTVTWVDWSRGGPHPAGFGKESVTEEFIKGIRHNATACAYNFKKTTVCYLFARKFTPSALEPLLLLSNSLMDF